MTATLDDFARIAADDHWRAIVAVSRPDGSVHTSLVSAGVLEHPITNRRVAAFVSADGAHKLALLRHARRAALTVHHGWQWIAVEGPAELVGPQEPGDLQIGLRLLLRAIFRSAGGTHDDWDAFDAAMTQERRIAVLIDPTRIVSNPG